MADFQKVFNNISEALTDLTSLDVITYKGTIKLEATDAKVDFDALLTKARAQADFKLLACTQAKLDGDMTVFYDKDATAADITAHNQLVDTATEKRAAVIKVFESAILNVIK